MLTLSKLPKTWLIDIDGTILAHNGYKNGGDRLLCGVKEFFSKIDKDDKIILLTARKSQDLESLKEFLSQNGVRYDNIITDLPCGERILINDNKPSGLKMCYAIPKNRDTPLNIHFTINEDL